MSESGAIHVLALAACAAVTPARAWATPPDTSSAQRAVQELVATGFLRALRVGQIETLRTVCAERFSFDGEVVLGADAVVERLLALRGRVPAPRRVVVLAAAEAIRRYGPPPARLADLAGPRDVVALARLSEGGLIAFLRMEEERWKVAGISD